MPEVKDRGAPATSMTLGHARFFHSNQQMTGGTTRMTNQQTAKMALGAGMPTA